MDEVGRDIHLKRKDWNIDGQTFDLTTRSAYYPDLFLSLLGEHQTVNAAAAIGCIERIRQKGYKVPRTSIYGGMREVRWAGRMQVVGQSPVILLDGAHSPTSAEALCKAIHEVFCYRRLILVVGLMRDKDLQAIGKILCPFADEMITTQAFNNPRVTPAEKIAGGMVRNRGKFPCLPECP